MEDSLKETKSMIQSNSDSEVLRSLADQINEAHSLAESTARSAVEHACRAGLFLIEAKAKVPHGKWLSWLAENCTLSVRTSQRYMQLAEYLSTLSPSNATRVSYLPFRHVLKGLARISSTLKALPEPDQGKVIDILEAEECPSITKAVRSVKVSCTSSLENVASVEAANEQDKPSQVRENEESVNESIIAGFRENMDRFPESLKTAETDADYAAAMAMAGKLEQRAQRLIQKAQEFMNKAEKIREEAAKSLHERISGKCGQASVSDTIPVTQGEEVTPDPLPLDSETSNTKPISTMFPSSPVSEESEEPKIRCGECRHLNGFHCTAIDENRKPLSWNGRRGQDPQYYHLCTAFESLEQHPGIDWRF